MAELNNNNCKPVNNYSCLIANKQTCNVIRMNDLASRIKEARDARGMTQPQVADELKLRYPEAKFSQQILSQLELDVQQTTGCIAELAEVLGVYTDWLALGRGPRDRDAETILVADPKLIAAVKLMQPMKEYQVDQALKILDTLAQPPGDQDQNNRANDG